MGVKAVIVTTTIDDRDRAEHLARSSVRARLAACAQVGGPLTSVYRWEGQIEHAVEFTVVLKTTEELADALVEHLSAEHPYDVPEVLAVPALGGDPLYLAWIDQETGPL
ncbi:MAG: periplasmic divalent cation tolerance protein [Actinomycetota bacterium]|nr:periplasmic divalent cation tolerance protein [Actinomycetota bacterium]